MRMAVILQKIKVEFIDRVDFNVKILTSTVGLHVV